MHKPKHIDTAPLSYSIWAISWFKLEWQEAQIKHFFFSNKSKCLKKALEEPE